MKSKKLLLAITSVIICLSTLLSACGKAVDVYTPPAETDSPFGEDPVTDAPELSADEIVYPEGELPKVYITTDDGKQVTSKNVYSTCNIRFEMNDYFVGRTIINVDNLDLVKVHIADNKYALKLSSRFIEGYGFCSDRIALNILIDLDKFDGEMLGFTNDSGIDYFVIYKCQTVKTIDGERVYSGVNYV